MLDAARDLLLERLGEDDLVLVLDVDAWASPFWRADWVLDLMPHATRGLYAYDREREARRERGDVRVRSHRRRERGRLP